jgi:hypothetical protein
VAKRPCRLTGLRTTIVLAAFVIFAAGAADTALAQTPPELKFLNNPLAKRAIHEGKEERAECRRELEQDESQQAFSGDVKDVETATTTVFVLLSGDQEARSIEFLPEVPAAGSEVTAAGRSGLSTSSYKQIVSQNRLFVQAEAARSGQSASSIKPSEVKAFNLTFLICSNSKSPGLGYYLPHNEIPVEWASFTGQLVVRDSANSQIGPGTVALQLIRPALGYERTYFTWIMVIALLLALIFLVVMYLRIEGDRRDKRGKLNKDLTFDFKTGLVIPTTAGAAIIGTLLTTTILPSDPFFMSRGQYATLNAVFVLVAALAGIVYTNKKKGWIFVIGAGLALGAGVGEAIAILFILKEMAFQGSLPARSAYILLFAVLGILIVVTVLALNKVASEINKPGRSAAKYPIPEEEIEYVTISRGEDGGPKDAKEEVINNQDAYKSFFDGSPPNTPDVNWEEEMIVAVALGQPSSGGYSVEITSIRLHTIGLMQGSVEIRYVEKVPSGVSTGPKTRPYHAVKCQRVGYRYYFIHTTDR